MTDGSLVGGAALAGVPYADLFTRAAGRHGVDASLLAAVASTESSFDARAVSPAGAQGLMQLMPATAARYRVQDVWDPAQNIEAGSRTSHSRHLHEGHPRASGRSCGTLPRLPPFLAGIS